MIPTIYGYSQEIAIDFGLVHDDLLVLREFAKTYPQMQKQLFEDGIYYCVDYKTLYAKFPLLNISYSAFRKYRIGNLVNSGVLERQIMQAKGVICGLRLGQGYKLLTQSRNCAKTPIKKTEDKNNPLRRGDEM